MELHTLDTQSHSLVYLGPGVEATTTGLRIETNHLEYPAWEDLFHRVQAAEGAVQWWLGDLLVYGEDILGEKHSQAFDPDDHTEDMLRRYRRVSRQYPHGNRFPSLSWTHHYAALAADEPLEALQWALNEYPRPSVSDLKKHIAGRKCRAPKPFQASSVVRRLQEFESRGISLSDLGGGSLADCVELCGRLTKLFVDLAKPLELNPAAHSDLRGLLGDMDTFVESTARTIQLTPEDAERLLKAAHQKGPIGLYSYKGKLLREVSR